MSVRYIRPLAGPIDRRRFARQADLLESIEAEEAMCSAAGSITEFDGSPYTPVGVFSPLERFQIRTLI